MSTTATPFYICSCDRLKLHRIEEDPLAPPRLQQAVQVVKLASQGLSNAAIMAEVGVERRKVLRWRSRFFELGVWGLMSNQPRFPMNRELNGERLGYAGGKVKKVRKK